MKKLVCMLLGLVLALSSTAFAAELNAPGEFPVTSDTDATITRRVEFDAIEGGLGRFVGERFDAFFETDAHLTRKRRNRNESLRILLEGVDAIEFDRIA